MFENLEKNIGRSCYQTLITLAITKYVKYTQKVKSAHFITIFNLC